MKLTLSTSFLAVCLVLLPCLVSAAKPSPSKFKRAKEISVCQFQKLSIKCPRHRFLHIMRAEWGRTPEQAGKCAKGRMNHNPFLLKPNLDCVKDVHNELRRECQKKSKCSFKPNFRNMGWKPCGGVSKILTVNYMCKLKHRVICQGQSKLLNCPRHKIIKVVGANYGRRNNCACRNGRGGIYTPKSPEINPPEPCITVVKNLVAEKCDGNYECSVEANDEVFPHNCPPKIFKVAKVFYKCFLDPKEKQKKNVCLKNMEEISCSKPRRKLNIMYVSRHNRSCRAGNGGRPTPRITKTCTDRVVKVMREMCQDKNSCPVSELGEYLKQSACRNALKYLSVQFSCHEGPGH